MNPDLFNHITKELNAPFFVELKAGDFLQF